MGKQLVEIGDVKERVVLVGVATKHQPLEQTLEYLEELEFLANTAGVEVAETFYQNLQQPDKRIYVGKGKLEEIGEYIELNQIDSIIVDDELSPTQLNNLEAELKVKILDRPMLILDIFATRAQTVQAKTQVELAQMQYLLPRLRGMWTHLDRQKGGIGMRGTGEKEIETDRRIAQKRISLLKQKLKEIDKQNETRRKQRGELIRVALVGYTNVGKSTLMNSLSKSEVFAENKLFATLDTTVRKVVLEQTPFLLSDTVGFIRKLPHHLVESFKSTLDETKESDLILHVVDISHPQFEDHIQVVEETLKDLNVHETRRITVFNKMDKYEAEQIDPLLNDEHKEEIIQQLKSSWMAKTENKAIFISAQKKWNFEELRSLITTEVQDLYSIRYPYRTQFW